MGRVIRGSTARNPRNGMDAYHQPVLLEQILELLKVPAGGVAIDATLGGGGHAEAILERFPDCRLIGIDQDEAALEHAKQRLKRFGSRFSVLHANFRRMDEALGKIGVLKADAVLMDIGVSSRQLEDPDRGFAFSQEGPLDMRMDRKSGRPAADWINDATEEELEKIIRAYGEERHAGKIAAAIARERKVNEIRTTKQLSELVARTVGFAKTGRRRSPAGRKIHPATRTFQAIRILVNDELGALEEGLAKAVNLLPIGGHLAVITFHSLEDRLAKQFFRREARETGRLVWVNKHVIRPERGEMLSNPRSRSAKLRVVEKVKE